MTEEDIEGAWYTASPWQCSEIEAELVSYGVDHLGFDVANLFVIAIVAGSLVFT